MLLFIMMVVLGTLNLAIGVMAAAQMGIGPGLNGLMKWRPTLLKRRTGLTKPISVDDALAHALDQHCVKQLAVISDYEGKYANTITSILDQINVSVAKIPWVAAHLEMTCRMLDGRYQCKTIDRSDIDQSVRSAFEFVTRLKQLFVSAQQLADCPKPIHWIAGNSQEDIEALELAASNFDDASDSVEEWSIEYARMAEAVCSLANNLQNSWRTTLAKCFESKPDDAVWPNELMDDPVHFPNKHIASALESPNDDRPMDRTVAYIEFDNLGMINNCFGRAVTESMLDYWLAKLSDLTPSGVAATTVSRSRLLFSIRTQDVESFTQAVELFRAQISKSKLKFGEHEIPTSASATIATFDSEIAVSAMMSKIRSYHQKSVESETSQTVFHSDDSMNALSPAAIESPLDETLIQAS